MGCCASSEVPSPVDFASCRDRRAQHNPATLPDSTPSDIFDAVNVPDANCLHVPVTDSSSAGRVSSEPHRTGAHTAAGLSNAHRNHRGETRPFDGYDDVVAVEPGRPRARSPTPPPPRLTLDALRHAAKIGTISPRNLTGLSARQQRRIGRATPSMTAALNGDDSPQQAAVARWVDDESARFVIACNPLDVGGATLAVYDFEATQRRDEYALSDERRLAMDDMTGSSQLLSQSAVTDWLASVFPEAA